MSPVASGILLLALGTALLAVDEIVTGLAVLALPLMLVVVLMALSVRDRSGLRRLLRPVARPTH